MVAFYNAADQELYKKYKFLPQEKYRLGLTLPTDPEPVAPVPGGITNTNAFNNSGNDFNPAGNAFGYGSQIEPGGSYGSYDSINYTGGLPGNVQQYGIGRQFEDPSASPTGETYSYKKEVPGFMRIAGGFIPGGNFLLNLAEKRMNANRDQPPGNYRIGGLDESMKGYYDNLAGSGMLYDGPGGVKTLTGKNFTGKGYLEGQLDIYNDKFAGMTEEEIEELKNDPRKQFKYKQYLESSQMYKTNEAQEKNKENMANLKAAESRRESARQYDPAVHGPTNYGLGSDGNQSYDSGNQGFGTNATTGGPVSNKTGRGRTDYMEGGRAGYFFGGRVNYKKGGRGRTDAESQYGADSAGSYDSSQNKSGRQQSYGGDNNSGARDNPPNFFVEDKTSIVDTSGLKSKSPEINIDYTDPRNYASLKGSIYNTNILDNDNINVDGTLSGEIGPVSYNTNFTDQGITNTNLTAGNFNADIDANKNYSLGYANNYNGIDYGAKYDNNGNLMFTAGVNFKNGGLAGLL